MADPLEMFYRGEPLNEEIRSLRAGPNQRRRPAARPAAETGPELVEPTNPQVLATRRREDLQEVVAHPGWAVFRDLQEKAYQFRQQSAIALSQIDPLNNAEKIATEWAYLEAYKQVLMDLQGVVTRELQQLEAEKRA